MERKWIFVLVALIAIVAVASVSYTSLLPEKPGEAKEIGEKDNTVINYGENNHTTIEYTDETGEHSGDFTINIKDGLDWIKTNTPEDSVFLCWWDHGHMVKGYAERDVIVRNPSEEILESVLDPNEIEEFDPHERIVDVATAFSTTDPSQTLRIMQKYGASYILVQKDDLMKASWIFWAAGLDPTEYIEKGDFNEKGKNTMIIRFLEDRNTGFVLVYHDQETKVYKID